MTLLEFTIYIKDMDTINALLVFMPFRNSPVTFFRKCQVKYWQAVVYCITTNQHFYGSTKITNTHKHSQQYSFLTVHCSTKIMNMHKHFSNIQFNLTSLIFFCFIYLIYTSNTTIIILVSHWMNFNRSHWIY